MPARHEDLNQSSRLDLDYDAEEDWGGGGNNYSPDLLNQIEESQSFSSDDASSRSPFGSSEESTAAPEAATSNASSSSSNEGPRPNSTTRELNAQKSVISDASSSIGHMPRGDSRGLNVQNSTISDASRSEGHVPRGGSRGANAQKRLGQHEEDSRQRQHKEETHHEANGYIGVGNNGFGRNIHREGTHSTINTSSSSSHNELRETGRKLVTIKLWDLGESSSAEPTLVTVAMEMPTNNDIAIGDDMMQDLSLEVGQQIQLRQQRRGSGRDYANGGEQAVDISWQPPPRATEDTWQPPFRISKEDQRISPRDQTKTADANQDHGFNKYQSSERLLATTKTNSTPNTESFVTTRTGKMPENEPPPAPVKGLEPFTIPSILCSTVVKRTPREKVGLAFRKLTGTVVIEKIVPGSPFDGTPLRPGYECLRINGHRLRSARRAAEIVRESGSSLTLVASNAPRPPGTMYTMISLKDHYRLGGSSMDFGRDSVVGMYFKMKHGLVQMVEVDDDSPIGSTSMKVGDFILAINGTVVGSVLKAREALFESNDPDMVPILYFNMRQLRVSLVDKVIGDSWKKEWSDGYDECVVLQTAGNNGSSSDPLTLRFKEEGMCELLDPLQAFRDDSNAASVVPPEHPLVSVVETLNHGIVCVLSAIRAGVELATAAGTQSKGNGSDVQSYSNENKNSSKGSIMDELAKLSGMYREGLLKKDDFEAIKSKLLKS